MPHRKQTKKEVTTAAYRKALAKQPKFCDLCGTTLKPKEDAKCELCRDAMTGPMSIAYGHWLQMGERFNRCCGRFSHDRTHLYFHGKYFDDSYPLSKKGTPLSRAPHVEVEHGVAFYRDYAQPYYLRDFDHFCDSVDYGDPVLYSSKNFWEEVEANFGSAAKAAWDSDLQTCNKCGYHYSADLEGCPCKERKW